MKDRLPIYRLAPQEASLERLAALGREIYGADADFAFDETRDSLRWRSGTRTVELARASGAVWAVDEAKMWKPSLKVELPKEAEVADRAASWLGRYGGLPKLDKPLAWGRPTIGGTHCALRDQGRRENRRLDIQVTFPLRVGEHRVVGGGSDFTLTYGHAGELLGVQGGVRPVTGRFDAALVPIDRATEQYRALMKKMTLDDFDLTLAYYAAPSFTKQEFLYPVYVGRGTARFGKRRVPLRNVLLPATDFGPPLSVPPLQPARPARARPEAGLEKAKLEAVGGARRALRAAAVPFEAGTSWIGQSGGLAGSAGNAQGFVDEWAADGWRINFNWGDANAWESDWRRNDDTWVDAADFVFYTGHASMDGWVLSNPDDGFLHFNEVGASPGNTGDLWGQNDLEWAIVAACGPLQDELLAAGGGDVLARWDGAFDGLHQLLGYGAITFDNSDEGRKVAQYAKGGATLIDAWFRAAKEIQPADNGAAAPDGPTVWVGAMWAGKSGADPFRDHAWKHGSVSADPRSPTWLAAMWTTC